MLLDASWNVQEITNYLKCLKSKAEILQNSQTAKSTLDLPLFAEQAEPTRDAFYAPVSTVLAIETSPSAEAVPLDH